MIKLGTLIPNFKLGNIQVAKVYLGATLVFENGVSGRIFNVGAGTGDLTIDGSDTSKSWYPLQTNDTFKILGGNYDSIEFRNLKAGSSGLINITNQSSVINVKTVSLSGTVMKIMADFKDKVSGTTYGMIISNVGDAGERLRYDENSAGGFETSFRGIDNKYFDDRGWRTINNDLAYDNGAGKMASKLFDVQYCRWTNDTPDQYRARAIDLFGHLDVESDVITRDTGYVETFIFKHNILENGKYDINVQNVNTFEVDDITLNNINTTVPSDGEGTYHARTIDIFGTGTARNIKGKNSYGALFRLAPFNRSADGTRRTSIVSNVISDTNTRYSAVEINTVEADNRVKSGVSVRGYAKVYGVTAMNLGSAGVYTSLAVDKFGDDEGLTFKNCVAINCYSGGLGLVAINGSAQFESNNVGYANNSLTKLNLTTYKPASDSVLKGAGVYSSDNPTDIYGDIRISPDTIGAVKAA